MAKLYSELPLAKDTPVNVAVKRPSVNLKEAENVGEQASAATHQKQPMFSKHGTYWPTPHPIDAAYGG
jgi:hypothetical protein